ncbi:MAG: penicillin-binding protein 1A [Rhizobiaceae bacterium]|jgi:penicillin-binding protein 1A|nr:penicillin-binding protein 1A [Rhizobiaceae bacterium]
MFRLIGYLFGIGSTLALLVAAAVAVYVSGLTEDLPDYEVLSRYEPPVMTRIHAADGSLMAEYARERRLYLPIQAVPDRVKAAFISAEDKNFYSHNGVDFQGLARAVIVNLQNMGSGRRPVGASTITQQVAKNFLLTSDQTIDRKVKEAMLAFRIEQAYSKDRILELYLNEIFFGLGAYGIAGAALTYFDKSVNELTVAEAAYLAGIIKAPNNYHPFRHTERALDRRNYVIDRMLENGYIAQAEAAEAKNSPLNVTPRASGTYLASGEYFTEEVRRELINRYGDKGLYDGGLSVRTSLDPVLQQYARRALHNSLIDYDRARGFRGPKTAIDLAAGEWGELLAKVEPLSDVPEWRLAVVLAASPEGLDVGLRPDIAVSGAVSRERRTASIPADTMKWALTYEQKPELAEGEQPDPQAEPKRVKAKSIDQVIKPGDVVYVSETAEGSLKLEQIPRVEGAMVAMDPHTGRVLAMAGGFSYASSEFNRATQAKRQPGSSFKPIVYAAALDNGYTPASVILDAPFSLDQGGSLGIWEPKNYSDGYAGPSTLRLGIEKSRNLMTVRLANDMGMKLIAEYAHRFGLYDNMLPVLAASLGSEETTVLKMAAAYSIMANGGKAVNPTVIDRIQDRYGRTVFRHDERICPDCEASEWANQPEPELVDQREQVLDPMTAYQITSMMEGVVQRGTATVLKELGRPVAGKTGTSNDEKDAWFVGYTPDLVVAAFMGFDRPRPMGRGQTGGELAAPMFLDFMTNATKDKPVAEFLVPPGMNLIAINRKTGMATNAKGGETIMEAFKPGTGPADVYSVIGIESVASETQAIINRAEQLSPKVKETIQSGGGGLF